MYLRTMPHIPIEFSANVAAIAAEAVGSDYEQDPVKMTSMPPARVLVGTGDVPITQISCGLQHTGEEFMS